MLHIAWLVVGKPELPSKQFSLLFWGQVYIIPSVKMLSII
jgi:hypothetical protein